MSGGILNVLDSSKPDKNFVLCSGVARFFATRSRVSAEGWKPSFLPLSAQIKIKKNLAHPQRRKNQLKQIMHPAPSPATTLILRWYLKVMVCVSGSCLPNLDVRKLIMGNLQISESVDWHSQM